MEDFIQNLLNTPDTTDQFDPADIERNKGVCICACFPILFWIPLVAAKDSAFGKYYANQGLIFLVTAIILSVASGLIQHIPFLGGVLSMVPGLLSLLLLVFLLVNVGNGRAKELPVVGHLFTAFQ